MARCETNVSPRLGTGAGGVDDEIRVRLLLHPAHHLPLRRRGVAAFFLPVAVGGPLVFVVAVVIIIALQSHF
jgi:hypothetical protein